MAKIEALKKITLLLESGSESQTMNISTTPSPFNFIYGVGPEGLSPFEYEMAEKSEGDELVIQLSNKDIQSSFQHLTLPPSIIPKDKDSFYLRIKIAKVVDAEQREIVKAMAEATACCDDCDGH